MRIINYIWSMRLLPYVTVFLFSRDKELLKYERDLWIKNWGLPRKKLRGFLQLLNSFPEYRSLFCFRTNANWLKFFARGQNNLEFYMPSDHIGKGLMIWHGFSTVINAERIGENCQIWQNVTIGHKNSNNPNGGIDRPILENNVRMLAGSMAIGGIVIGHDSTIGGNAVAVKDVPAHTTIVGSPVRYLTEKKQVITNNDSFTIT